MEGKRGSGRERSRDGDTEIKSLELQQPKIFGNQTSILEKKNPHQSYKVSSWHTKGKLPGGLFFSILMFELSASQLLGKCSTTCPFLLL
jgi:hypothetical protein